MNGWCRRPTRAWRWPWATPHQPVAERLAEGRRARLGLADPVVANRFLLWCLWSGGLLGASVVILLFRFMVGDLDQASPALQTAVVVGVTGPALGGGISLWLAFFPPPAYILRLRAGAA